MKPKYKATRAIMPFCLVCDEQLKGNGGFMSPYQCECGVWRWRPDGKEYRIISHGTKE